MLMLIGYGLIAFLIVNLFVMIVAIYKDYQENKGSVLRAFISITFNLIFGTYGLYTTLVLGALILGILIVFY